MASEAESEKSSGSRIIIESEEQAFELLDRALSGEQFPDLKRLSFKGWPTYSIKFTGRDWNGTIPTRVMQPLLELQKDLNRAYADIKYDEPNPRRLREDERENVEIVVKVNKGSRELLNLELLDDAGYAIKEAEAAVGNDAPMDRYKVRLLVLRAQKTTGISATDRGALLRKAYELASKNIDHHKWDRHSYRTLCEVALLLMEQGIDVYLADEATHRMRLAASDICDPEMDRDLQKLEAQKARLTKH